MRFDPDRAEVVEALRAAVRDVCTDLGGTAAVRALDVGAAWSEKGWSALSIQVGIAGLGLPEAVGGVGGVPEIAAVAEELGRHLLPVPFLTSTVMAGQLLTHAPGAEALLEKLAAGRQTAVSTGLLSSGSVTTTAATAVAPAVPDAAGARWLLAGTDAGAVLVDLTQDGVHVEPVDSLDLARPAARVSWEARHAVPLPVDDAGATAARAVARVAMAAEQLGGAQACLDRTVDYVRTRRQFGRAVGSFQAVKHTVADLLVQVEMARSAVDRAVTLSHDPAALSEAALVAQIWCSEAFRVVSAEAVQLHGGIGFTWEHDAHLYFRRARADAVLLGPVAAAREELATLLEW